MSDTIPGQFCWNQLVTQDSEAAKRYYQQLLGWECHDLPINNTVFTVFKKDGRDIASMIQLPSDDQQTPSHWLNYIKVDCLETIIAQHSALGGAIILPIQEIANYGRFAVVKDPSDAVFAFWQASGSCDASE